MFRIKEKWSPSVRESSCIILMVLLIMSICIGFFQTAPHVPILIVIIGLLVYGLLRGIKFIDLENGMIEGARAGLGAVYIFFLIGILISAWMMGGTIPTLLYIGFHTVTPHLFFAIVFIVTSIIGVAIGSSLTTVATVGVAFIGMAGAMDLSLAITAGAIVSGAFFGDKMSPLSDTTNLASGIVGVDLFAHIRNMAKTTIPAFIIALIIYAVLSPSNITTDLTAVESFKEGLLASNLVNMYSLLPIVVLVVMTLKKAPAFLTLAVSAFTGVILSLFIEMRSTSVIFNILFNGFESKIGIEAVDQLLSRGGMSSMFFTIALVLLALSMGGLLFTLGIIQSLLRKVERLFNSAGTVVTGAALSGIGINTIIGEQYLSILLTGEAFRAQFAKLGLAPKNLSRVMEDAGTVVNPLVPWSVCGIFIASVLDVSTISYLPFAFFCLLSPILTVLFGWTGKSLTYER